MKKENVPTHLKCRPELDESRLLASDEATEHQKLIGILQWRQSSLRLGIDLVVPSLARHQFSPRENHRLAVIKAFERLKKHPKRGAIAGPAEPTHVGETKIIKLDLGNQH